MEEGLQGGSRGGGVALVVYSLGLEERVFMLSAEVPYARVSVRPREGSRLNLPLPPTPPRILFWLQSGSGSD